MSEHSPRPKNGFRWRTIPAAFVGFMAAFMLVTAAFSFVYMTVTAVTGQPLYVPGPDPGWTQEGFLIFNAAGAAGVLLAWSARLIWVGRWRLASVIILAVIATVQIGVATGLIPE